MGEQDFAECGQAMASGFAETAPTRFRGVPIDAASGPHTLLVKGWDNSGKNFSKQLAVTINKPPVAALALSSGSILAGGSVTASAAASTDSDGAIASAIMHTHLGFVMTTLLGIVGSIIGGLIARLFSRPPEGTPFHPAGLILSIIGAIIVLFIVGKIT